MPFLNSPIMGAAAGKMAYLAEREAVISENIANANTPDYRAKDLPPADFNAMMVKHYNKLPMTRTSSMHMQSGFTPTRFEVVDDRQASETIPVGNNVVLEEQALKLSETATDYQLASKLYTKMHGMMRLAVQPSNQ
ncbi:MAG: flgB [Rickettsiales bacterium]|jgi:flagellar basal-body rod protein FlgB|nr:flgB [Rickettsiales bacterium]